MICNGCYGSKKVMGAGMVYHNCPICSSPASISIRYKKAIKEMQEKFDLSEEEATRIFEEESARIDDDEKADKNAKEIKEKKKHGRPRKNSA